MLSRVRHYQAFSDYQLSADKRYLMIQAWSEKVFRRSSISEYFIFELKDGRTAMTLTKLRPNIANSDSNFDPVDASEPFYIR